MLDLDATDDAIHGKQEGRFFHGYYGHYCYLPLYIVSGKHVLTARLRPSNIDASAGTIEELAPVVARIRARWPQVPIWIRADAGFCRDDIMAWCEAQGLHYIIGMPRNARLQRIIEEAMQQSQATCEASGQPSRRFRSFEYRTKDSWSSCAARDSQGGMAAWTARLQRTIRGHQFQRRRVRRAHAIRGFVLCAWRHGEPAQGAAADPVR